MLGRMIRGGKKREKKDKKNGGGTREREKEKKTDSPSSWPLSAQKQASPSHLSIEGQSCP